MADSMVGGAFDLLIKIGFMNLIVPFILFYAIVFGMLEKTQLFASKDSKGKDEMKNLHSLIAFALAITATAASYAVGITQNFLPILGIASVILLGLMMVLGMAFGPQFEEISKTSGVYKGIIWACAIVLIIAAMGVIAYNGLIVGTPCNDKSLTPVNSLNPGPGQCTKFMEISATNFYLMGFDVSSMMKNIFTADVIGIIIFLGLIVGLPLFIMAKNKKGV
ncbi:MAG: hypothetical protein PHN56_04545 [Candidatus Nanoarchaeia archaeon]|nr:hypothetical protein [Candidatus Nanoarchaeia archaeon]